MVRVRKDGWLERVYAKKSIGVHGKNIRPRDWWIVKHSNGNDGRLSFKMPKEWIGKKVRIKIEEVSDENSKRTNKKA